MDGFEQKSSIAHKVCSGVNGVSSAMNLYEIAPRMRTFRRDTTLRQKDLARMLHRWEVPLPWEAHAVHHTVEH